MMDGTDRHCRYFHRLITRHARLYSEMVTVDAVLHGDRDYLLGFDPADHPVALQLGGSDPAKLAEAARIGEGYGYDEINLNVGCPSDRVQSGAFGACLMKTPDLVAECIAAMRQAVSIPVTIKTRIGVDDQDPEDSLFTLAEAVRQTGCRIFIVHARKAWLEGLSPKENRTVPPLDYDLVRRLKARWPELQIILNGGLETVDQANAEMTSLDGVMLGRAPYARPYMLSDVDRIFFDDRHLVRSREDIVLHMDEYIRNFASENGYKQRFKPHSVTRHMIGLFHGQPGARLWRQALSKLGSAAPLTILTDALEALSITASADILSGTDNNSVVKPTPYTAQIP